MSQERTTGAGTECSINKCASAATGRRLFGAACFAIFFLSVAPALAQPPLVNFSDEDTTPGIQLPFNKMNGVDPFIGDIAIDFGRQSPAGGNYGWIADDFQSHSGTGSGDAALGRYVPTGYYVTEDAPPYPPGTAMLETLDWGFHMEFRHVGVYNAAGNGEFIMFTKHVPADWGGAPDGREDRIFNVRRGVDDNDWSIMVGNSTGGWSEVIGDLVQAYDPEQVTPEQYVDFDVHYRSAEQEMDFYWESELVATASTGHGRYDLDFLQFEYREPWGGYLDVRNFRLSHNLSDAPPPSLDGDYNNDGNVDAADYILWRLNENNAGLPGTMLGDGDDGTGTGTPDGIVDESDYEFWVSRFGATSGGAGGGGAVPEPAGLMLLTVACALIAPWVRYRAS